MKNNSFRKWLVLSALFGLMCISPHILVRAQSVANYAFSTSTSGTLEDLSAGSTSIMNVAVHDDDATAVTPLGFNFVYMGVPYSHFSTNSNGQFLFHTSAGATAIAGGSVTPSAGVPCLFPMSGDNELAGGIRYKVIGSAPNRKFVLEWTQFYVYFTNINNAGNMQLWLHETTGQIEFVYGETYNSNSATVNRSIGITTGVTATTQGSVTVSATPTYSGSATFASNTFAANTGGATATPLIANIGTNVEGTRRVYSFTPAAAPTAPSALSFAGVNATSMTLNWTDNSTTEAGYRVYRSTDNVNYTVVGQLAANTITYNATSLSPSTLYYWKVIAYSELESTSLDGSQATTAGVITGVKTVGSGGDYQNLTTAFADINAQGLGGNVELQLITGYPAAPETYPIQSCNSIATGTYTVKVYPTVSGLSITSANAGGTLNLNSAANLTFDGRVNQTGANDLVIANTNAGASYAILFNNDAHNNAITHAIVRSVNNSVTSGTIVFGTTTGANGNDNNAVTFCDIADGATSPLNAIYASGTTTTTAQANDNNTISDNNISNFFSAGSATNGILISSGNSAWTISNNKLFQTATRTYTSANTHNGIQINNTSGNGFVITGNTIGYASSNATGVYTMTGTIATRFIGINVAAGTTVATSVQGNTIAAINLTTSSGAATANGILACINITGGNVNVGNVTPNIIGSATGTGSLTATTTSTGGLIVGVNSSSAGTVNISGNTIGSITALGSTATISASISGIQVTAGTPTIHSNIIGSTTTANSFNSPTVSTSTTGQFVRGIDISSGVTSTTSIQFNTIANMNGASTATAAAVRGIAYAGTGVATINQNTVFNISGASANTASSGGATAVQGILYTGSSASGSVTKNVVYNIAATNTGAVQTNVSGIGYSNPLIGSISGNTVYDLRNASTMATATTPPTAIGILIRALATSVTVSNNMISLGDAQTTNTEFVGIWNSFSTTGLINVYHNSVSISGTAASGALPSYAVLRGDNSATAVTTPVDIRNNILSNTRTGGTGKHYAIANQSAPVSTTGWGVNASNYNALNANAATIGLWGATDETFNAWRTASSGDASSVSGIPVTFVNVPTANLHLNMGVTATALESGGAAIAAVTTDYDNEARPGPAGSVNGGATAPDLGADEFDGVPAIPVITLNSVTPPATAQCVAAARLISVNVNPSTGTVTAVNLGYTVNGTAQTPIAMTNTSGTTWTATIPVPTPVNATIAWGVTATNSAALTGSYTGTPYSDEPLLGSTASVTSSVGTVCASGSSTLTASLVKNVNAVIGTATTLTSATAQPTAFCNRWSSYRMQTIYTAAELTAAGLTAGPITSMSFNITTLGDGATNGNFTVKVGTTALTAFTDFVSTTGYTTVFPAATYTHAVGVNVINFSTPYVWNGTSNIVVEVSHDGANATNNSQTYYTATPGNTVAWSTGGSATGTPSTNRLNVVFAGNGSPAIQSISWSDGAITVGTTNPLTVNPTTNTTYTATITAAGCTVTPAPTVSVAVNPLPATPTAVNSAQCGVQVPTAHVTSTSGLPTPTFNWYTVSTGGTASQSSTSTTYTSTVAATTTFYVSELNTVTGCESVRVPVTVTVSTPDQVSLTSSVTAICVGGSFTLTAANMNPTPFQNYTYSTECATAGSGAETPLTGSSLTVTPTAAGSFTYTLTGVDGGCAATATVTVTVNAVPNIGTPTATPATVCSGDNIHLVGNIGGVNPGPFVVGAGANIGSDGYYSPFYHLFGGLKEQYIIRASELTAAGLTAGYISSVALNIGTVGTTYAGYTVHMGTTANADLSAGLVATPLTQVYSSASLTLVPSSLNTFTLTTPFLWDGTSNLIVQTSWSNNNSGGSSSEVQYDNTAYVSTAYYRSDNETPAVVLAGSPATSTRSTRPKMTFGMGLNALYNWSWSPGTGLNTVTAVTSISNTTGAPINQVFTVTATDPATGCAASATTSAVTINPAPAAPVANNGTRCGTGVPTASVTGSGTPGNTYSWYLTATGGTALPGETGSSLSAYSISTTTTFYVSEGNGTCSSGRTAVTATVTPAPVVTIAGTNVICNGSTTALTASSSNDPNYTYTWSGGLGTGATVNASPTANTTYTVTANDVSGGANNGCVASATISITVNPAPLTSPVVPATATICAGTVQNLTSAPVTVSNTAILGTGTTAPGSTSFPNPFSAWYGGTKHQILFTAAELAAQGLVTGSQVTSVALDVNAFVGSACTNFTIRMGNTSNTALTGFVTGTSTVYGPTTYTPSATGIVTFTLTTPFTWNGTSNIVVETVHNAGNGGNGSGTRTNTTTTTANTVFYGASDNVAGGIAGFDALTSWTNTGASNLRPNIRFAYTSPLSPTWSPAGSLYTDAGGTTAYTGTAISSIYAKPTTTTTYVATYTGSNGCTAQSSATITVNQPSTSTTTASECDSYSWNGTTYTTSGVYTYTTTNSLGCDSVATLNLTIKHSTDSIIPVAACSSYTWAQTGLTYNTSGLYRDTIANAAGCDSVITLDLTINMPNTGTVTATGCGSYTWALNGQIYTASGAYTHTIQNSLGCDSVVTLNLTMGQANTGIDTQVACETFTWIDGVVYTASTNTPTFTLTNASGCDSVVTLHLTINQNTVSTVAPVTTCGSYTWPLSGQTYTTSGAYTHTIGNAAGCDSVITLNLTIHPQPVVTITNNGNGSFVASSTVTGTIAWLNCTTNTLVSGATAATYTPTANGSYAAIVTTANGCSDTSACLTITNVGIKENSVSAISVHPNPTHDFVIVTMEAASATVEVFDAQGKLVQTSQIKSGDQIDLGAYERGVYTLKIKTEIGTSVERIVKN